MKRNICLCYGLANKVRDTNERQHTGSRTGGEKLTDTENKNPGKMKLSHKDKVATKELKIKCKVQIDEHTGTKTRQEYKEQTHKHTLMRG